MNILKEKTKWKDILQTAIDVALAAATVLLVVILLCIHINKAESAQIMAEKAEEYGTRIEALENENKELEQKYGKIISDAEAVYLQAAETEAAAIARYNDAVAEKDALDAEIAEAKAYPAKVEEARRAYAAKIAELEQLILSGKSDVKIAYLTFDDGPYINTAAILDTLKEHDAKVTFFTNGHRTYGDLLRREFTEGHAVANHTYSHGISTGLYRNVDSFMEQVKLQDDFIYETTGFTTELVRFPGGSNTAGRLKEDIKAAIIDAGYAWVDWDALTGDSTAGAVITRDFVMGNLKSSVKDKPITVVLLHDLKKITRNTVGETLDYLESKGYIFLPLFYESCKVNK